MKSYSFFDFETGTWVYDPASDDDGAYIFEGEENAKEVLARYLKEEVNQDETSGDQIAMFEFLGMIKAKIEVKTEVNIDFPKEMNTKRRR